MHLDRHEKFKEFKPKKVQTSNYFFFVQKQRKRPQEHVYLYVYLFNHYLIR